MSLFSRFVRFLVALALVLPLGLAVPVFDAEAKKFRGFGGGKKSSSSSKKTKKKDADDADGESGGSWGRVKIPRWRGGDDDDDGSRAATKKPEDELPPAPEDYYTKRAKALLAADKAVHDSKPHPLAKGFPDQFVVVCEGGCPNRQRAQIIDMQPRPKTTVTVKVKSTMVPTASSSGETKSAALQDGIVCMAGCYNGMKKTYAGRAAAAAGAGAGYEDTWMTTVSDSEAATTVRNETKSESGSWLSAGNRRSGSAAATADATTTAFAADEPSPPAVAPAPKTIAAVPAIEEAADAKAAPVAAAPAVSASSDDTNSESKDKASAPSSDMARTPADAEALSVVVEAEVVTSPAAPAKAAPPMTVVNAGAAETTDSPNTTESSQLPDATDAATVPNASAPEPDVAVTEVVNAASEASALSSTPAPATKGADTPVIAKDEAEKAQRVAAVQTKTESPETTSPPDRADQPVLVSSKDPEMNAAIRKARGSLDSFWAKLASPVAGETDFSVKVAIKDGKNVEHFWVIGVKRDGEKISGTINNEPELVKNVTFGEHYEFTEDVISDWLYRRNGKMVGNETMRPLLKRMPEDAAAPYWAMYENP